MGPREPPEASARPAGRSRSHASRAYGASLDAHLLDGSLWVEVAGEGALGHRATRTKRRFHGVEQDLIFARAVAARSDGQRENRKRGRRSPPVSKREGPLPFKTGCSRERSSAQTANPATANPATAAYHATVTKARRAAGPGVQQDRTFARAVAARSDGQRENRKHERRSPPVSKREGPLPFKTACSRERSSAQTGNPATALTATAPTATAASARRRWDLANRLRLRRGLRTDLEVTRPAPTARRWKRPFSTALLG